MPDAVLGDPWAMWWLCVVVVCGVLGVWSYAESSPFADALREVFDQVRVEPVSYDNQLIDERRTDWLFFAQ